MARSPRTRGPAVEDKLAVNTTSSEYDQQLPYWQMTRTMMKGTKAMRINARKYLPKFESEEDPDFLRRASTARYTNIFADIVKSLADRPFAKEPIITVNTAMEPLIEDIDGQGNHAFVFMADWMRQAITTGIHWCLVDYASVKPYVIDASGVERRKSVAEERGEGARSYALLIQPEDVIAVYSGMISGKEYITHVRIRESYKIRDEWKEKEVERVRVLDRKPVLDGEGNIIDYEPATFAIYERTNQSTWTLKHEGPIFIGVIAMVPLIIGSRATTGWMVEPDMEDCAYLQLEYFEQENGLKNIKTLTAYPMLSADGVDAQIDPKTKKVVRAPVGPRAILYGGAPKQGVTQGGSWKWLEPQGSSLTFLREDLKELAKELRELGRQPLVATSSNITKETAAFASAKGKAAIRRWAGQLKDAMENVLKFMAMWEGVEAEPEVVLNLDDLDEVDGDTGLADVEKMYDKQVVSKKTYRLEAKRRGTLSDSFDEAKEDAQIEKEAPDDPSLDDEKDALLTRKPGDPEPDPEDEDNPDNPPPED